MSRRPRGRFWAARPSRCSVNCSGCRRTRSSGCNATWSCARPRAVAIDIGAVGKTAEPFVRSWDSRDALLYALSVGAGQADPGQELHFTTENTAGLEQRVIPSLVIPLVQTGLTRTLNFG